MVGTLSIVADSADWGHMDGWGTSWMWLWGTLMMVGLVAFVVWLARGGSRVTPSSGPSHGSMEQARSMLAKRYANGDLSTEEYRERLDELDRAGS